MRRNLLAVQKRLTSVDIPLLDPDQDLLDQCRSSDPAAREEAFAALYERHKNRVYSITTRITGNAADGLDAAQETFITVYRKLDKFRGQAKFSSWVYRVAVNASIDHMRRVATRRMPSLEHGDRALSGLDLVRSRLPGPVGEVGKGELESEVQDAVGHLSPKLKSVVVLRHMEGMTYEEVSHVLELSLGTVKSRLARAHAALEQALAPVLEQHFTHFDGGGARG